MKRYFLTKDIDGSFALWDGNAKPEENHGTYEALSDGALMVIDPVRTEIIDIYSVFEYLCPHETYPNRIQIGDIQIDYYMTYDNNGYALFARMEPHNCAKFGVSWDGNCVANGEFEILEFLVEEKDHACVEITVWE